MATKRIQLAIDTPCQQQWQEMKSMDTGRFCDHCQKTVVDFSALADHQIADVLAQSLGSTCGRFRLSQLNRTLHVPAPASHSPGRFVSLLTAGLLGYQTIQAEALSITAVPATAQSARNPTSASDLPVIDTPILTDSLRIITGRVTENVTKTALGGVFIIIKGTDRGANTDSAGHFQLTVPAEIKEDLITLTVGFIGFQTQEIQLRPDRSGLLSIVLNEDQAMLGEVIVVGGYKKLPLLKRLQNRLRGRH